MNIEDDNRLDEIIEQTLSRTTRMLELHAEIYGLMSNKGLLDPKPMKRLIEATGEANIISRELLDLEAEVEAMQLTDEANNN
jgi:hypothetical protein